MQYDYQIELAGKGGGVRPTHTVHMLRAVLRAITMRHTMAQQRDGAALLALPPKLEEVIEIDFEPAELNAYRQMHTVAKKRFDQLKKQFSDSMHLQMFKITSLLVPLRQACSGGDSMRSMWHCSVRALKVPDEVSGAGASGGAGTGTAALPIFGDAASSECAICMEQLDRPALTPCGHLFCYDCITTGKAGSRHAPCHTGMILVGD